MKKLLRVFAMALAFLAAGQAKAGIPVLDLSNLYNTAAQVVAWGKQYEQMATQYTTLVQQYNQAVTAYNSIKGIRGMASLVNNPTLRRYLPNEWSQAMNLMNTAGGYSSLSGSINSIKTAAKILGIEDTGLDANSASGRAFVGSQNQAAMNRAMAEEGYRQASDRITAIQALIDKVDGVPDAKDVADLQARIQGEQAMIQNETVKLALMSQLQQAQRDIQYQQAREISIQSTRAVGGIPRF